MSTSSIRSCYMNILWYGISRMNIPSLHSSFFGGKMGAQIIYLHRPRLVPELETPLYLPDSPFMVRPLEDSEIANRTIHSIAHLEIVLQGKKPLWKDRPWMETLLSVIFTCDEHRELLVSHFVPSLRRKRVRLYFRKETTSQLRITLIISEEGAW